MKTIGRLALLVLLLNVIRYLVGGPLEAVTIMEPMHRVMPLYPDVFDTDFTSTDFTISLIYNYMMWFWATVAFHFMHPRLSGPMWVRSLKSYLIMAAFFWSLAAVYMNHYVADIKPFYFWSMIDALILFPLIGLANAIFYPRFFPQRGEDPA
jgi:hypothetical protein